MSVLARLVSVCRSAVPAPAPVVDYPFVASDVALYQRMVHGAAGVVDDQTWNDLMLAQYSERLAPGTSIFGRQELYRRLQARADSGLAACTERLRMLVADDAARACLQAACAGLRQADSEVSVTLFGPALAAAPRWVPLLGALPLSFMAAIVLALLTGSMLLWGVVLGLWLALMAVQMRFHQAVADWQRQLGAIALMLRAHVLLAGLEQDTVAAPLRADAAAASKLNRRLWLMPLTAIPGLSEYGDWVLLRNVRHYFATRAVVAARLPLLRTSFTRVAAVEADLALARHLAATPRYCWSTRHAAPADGAVDCTGAGVRFAFEHAVHPLLDAPTPLSLRVGDDGRGAFLSGQNGIGKSTLLRTVGLNLVTARAFGFCYASAAVTPDVPVHASMQNEDALEGGESLYLAEVRRAGELLALARRGPAVFLIDEIFRGTNHLESVSASAAVLDTLARAGCVLVSSHNLILAPLLAQRLAPLCVARVAGMLQVAPGVLRHTNGLALLAAIDADGMLAAKAGRVYDMLADYYLTTPPADAAVLD
ncbi:DNA mismatch repair protein MutS [Duganella sp. Leaf126]|uniref:MutS-related protein n=1 Tax=Duganella sp. Leaf126 TaxID=1736266 RepID=UPI0006F90B33|nr:DNA mismatch repair protein MutS [Duganella sp. Leaf126]KQQ47687.1 DNA mismatch repair protein MutS [Duganella sp. Leaf126]